MLLCVNFISFSLFQGTELFTNWVGLNVDFQYVKPIFDLVNTTQTLGNGTLLSRGEAHVSIILPTEYDQVLHPAGVTIEELNTLASTKNRLQRSKFELECLGRVQVVSKPDGVFQQSVQIILKNYKDLIHFREEVFKLYVKKGGNPALFAAENFTPHITLGFKHRDIFIEDGVYKGKNACIHKIVAK
ncbi:hypothetical protein BC939DRAFT_150250 [Gamsiella multidivaricata]|uniref:uncharacterized protein n=1 Tax=Gamsiella multidivaricata TaxID=101098 RepID=UPI00221F5103|nr:uncharacterized protein BC939DRAFT_150250 [Gamsiella multidivaricata]KAI7831791.1 hypothetical protein BC939DRAFT_150250 [Gamsiella multidivaricata]